MKNKIISGLAGLLISAGSLLTTSNAICEEAKPQASFMQRLEEQVVIDERANPGFVKSRAYWVFGAKYYIKNMGYPTADWKFDYQQIKENNVPLKENVKKCDGADESGWVPVPIGNKTYYRAEYHLKDLNIPLEKYVDEVSEEYQKKGIKKVYTAEEKGYMIERSKLHISLFPKSEFKLRFHAGSYLLIHENGDQESAKCAPREGIEVKSWYTKILPEERNNLVGLFNGTFWNQDTTRKVNGEDKRAGLILEGKTIDKPINGLASIAVYDDESFKIGLYEEMPDKEKIKFMRQNESLLLHNGEIREGAYPMMWRSFNDEVVISYFVTTKNDSHFGYAWTTHTPQSVFAKTMQKFNFGETMLIDIHPVINSVLASPRKEEKQEFTKNNSYYFVPNEEDVVNMLVRTLATKIKGPIQYNSYTPMYFSEKDFFSVDLK
ncbi:MAG: hypothetical protein WC781_04785 [Candidatus Pacearchaeota archaeon]|jgi:hypothetical protein